MAALAGRVRAVAYDRAGLGDSDPDPQIPSAERAVADLSTLISLVNAGPCVVAGHSWGGLLALLLAEPHPNQVAGLVLVDPALPGMLGRMPGPVRNLYGSATRTAHGDIRDRSAAAALAPGGRPRRPGVQRRSERPRSRNPRLSHLPRLAWSGCAWTWTGSATTAQPAPAARAPAARAPAAGSPFLPRIPSWRGRRWSVPLSVPRQAQGRRRPDQRPGLCSIVLVSPPGCHPPVGLDPGPEPGRHHHRLEPRQNQNPPQPQPARRGRGKVRPRPVVTAPARTGSPRQAKRSIRAMVSAQVRWRRTAQGA